MAHESTSIRRSLRTTIASSARMLKTQQKLRVMQSIGGLFPTHIDGFSPTNHFFTCVSVRHMVIFNIPSRIPDIMVAASMHGAADICRPRHLYPYTLLFAPLPPTVATTVLFLISSVWHFAQDIGWRGALGLHTACGLVYFLMDPTMAFGIMSLYYCALHVPMCYIRLATRRSYLALTIIASLTLIAYGVSKTMHAPPCVNINDRLQLLVICHVLSDASQRHIKL